MGGLVFLKLGGSLITDKTRPYAVRADRLDSLMAEISTAMQNDHDLRLLLGHGSGSFGHFAVQDHLAGLRSPFEAGSTAEAAAYWQGYSEVRYRAAELNHHVMEAMHRARIPAVSLQPSAMVKATDGELSDWDLTALESAMATSLVPVIYGDIVFDAVRGSTVLSTEALMTYLAPLLKPGRILLAGIEAAVWADYPARRRPISRITPHSYADVREKVGSSHGTDVTGGMRAKVEQMLALIERIPGLTVQILSGVEAGNVSRALEGDDRGTVIASD